MKEIVLSKLECFAVRGLTHQFNQTLLDWDHPLHSGIESIKYRKGNLFRRTQLGVRKYDLIRQKLSEDLEFKQKYDEAKELISKEIRKKYEFVEEQKLCKEKSDWKDWHYKGERIFVIRDKKINTLYKGYYDFSYADTNWPPCHFKETKLIKKEILVYK